MVTAPLMVSVSGVRGIFGKSVDARVGALYGQVFGSWVRGRRGGAGRARVVVGRDGRAGGEVLLEAVSAGLRAGGCDVLSLGVATTPTVGVLVDERDADGGIVVTASHNPQEWNGLKPIVRGAGEGVSASAPGKEEVEGILGLFDRGECELVSGTEVGGVERMEGGGGSLGIGAEHTHIAKVREALRAIGAHDDRSSVGIRCVLDSVNGSGRMVGVGLLGDRLVHHLGSSDNGIFPHTPEPTAENLGHLARFVAEKGADVGFAQDPDADRLALVDETGRYIGEEYTLVLAAEALLGSGVVDGERAVLATNLSTSRMIDDVAARYGARVVRTAVGEANVVSAMKREGCVLGGEGNGGVIWPAVTYIRDSVGAMGLVLALLAREKRKLSEIVDGMPRYAIVKRKVGLARREDADGAVERVAGAFAGEKLDLQDGVRVDVGSERGWVHVRASNTEPIMRLIAEAPTVEAAEGLLGRVEGVIGG